MLVSTGFSKFSDREICIWKEGHLKEPVKTINLDSSSGNLSILLAAAPLASRGYAPIDN